MSTPPSIASTARAPAPSISGLCRAPAGAAPLAQLPFTKPEFPHPSGGVVQEFPDFPAVPSFGAAPATPLSEKTSLTAGTVFQGTKLPLTVWFLALYLISQAKTGLSALALKRHLGVSYPTAWRIHHKVMQAMAARDAHYVLAGQV